MNKRLASAGAKNIDARAYWVGERNNTQDQEHEAVDNAPHDPGWSLMAAPYDVPLSPIDARRAFVSAAGNSIPVPRDIPFPGLIALNIDATDTDRGIFSVRATIPVADTGAMTRLYPKWMPGYHSPQNPIELFAGLEIRAGDLILDWRRDALEVYAFYINVPDHTDVLDVCFQFLSPTASGQGDVVVTDGLLNIQFGRMLLYPAGYYSRTIQVQATITLPDKWAFSTVLEAAEQTGATVTFESTSLDVLVDSPLMAGRHVRDLALDETVHLSLFAHNAADLAISADQIKLHVSLVAQADRLFASRHFDRYCFLVALSKELGGGGIEHHRSAEIIVPPRYLEDWAENLPKRDVFAREFTHSWNGKYRRAAGS